MILAFALIVAEVYWLHFKIVGIENCGEAVEAFPQFVRQYSHSFFIAAVFAGFGAYSVFTYAASW